MAHLCEARPIRPLWRGCHPGERRAEVAKPRVWLVMHPLEDGLREARFPDFQAHLRSTRQHRRRPSPAPSAASTARSLPQDLRSFPGADAESGKRVQVFTPYPGRIIALYASVGDDVKKGQTLFTIGRPRSPAGRVHSDRGRARASIEHPQSGAASRAL